MTASIGQLGHDSKERMMQQSLANIKFRGMLLKIKITVKFFAKIGGKPISDFCENKNVFEKFSDFCKTFVFSKNKIAIFVLILQLIWDKYGSS